MQPRAPSFGYVFWALVTAVFLLAVVGSSAMVWWTSRPFLVDLQTQRLREELDRDATTLRRVIEEQFTLLTYLAGEAPVISFVIGEAEGEEAVADRLSALAKAGDLRRIRIFDFSGTPIFPSTDGGEPMAADLADLVSSVLEGRGPGNIPVLYRPGPGGAQMVIAAPALNHGMAEGVLTAAVALDMGALFPGRSVTLDDTQSGDDATPPPGDRLSVRVAGTSLELSIRPEGSEIAAAGRELVWRNIVAVALVLLAPFAALGLVGRSILVLPHVALMQSRDILREQQKELKELAAIARAAEEAIMVTDLSSRIVWVNPSFERMSGRSADEVKGRIPGEFLQGPETSQDARAAIQAGLKDRRSVSTEILNYAACGRAYWISLSISPLFDETGAASGYMSVASDITERKAQQAALAAARDEIERQALHDELTGLPNRRHFEQEYQKRAEADERTTLIRIDLDHFKDVNDTHGHAAGDAVLRQIGAILRDETRPGDLPVRIGGDEFVVMMIEREDANPDALARRLQTRFGEPIWFDGTPISVGASFGIASSSDTFLGRATVLGAADAALYKAKDGGRNAVCTYSESVHSEVTSTRRLSFQLRAGIERGEFVPHYQPQFDAATRTLAGLEVLVRWNHPDRGLLHPADFLPIAAQLKLASRIDAQLMPHAFADIRTLVEGGIAIPKVSFNITADRLLDVETLIGAIGAPLAGTRIAFEILESVLLEDKADAIDLVFDLMRDYDISIEIDDFGSGHASIVSLMRMRPDVLKLDPRLVHPLPHSPRHRDLVASLIALAGSLGVGVTAEGVETAAHADLLTQLGAQTLQGYHLAEPMPIEALARVLQAQPPRLVPVRDAS